MTTEWAGYTAPDPGPIVPGLLGRKGGLKGVYDLRITGEDKDIALWTVSKLRGDQVGAILGLIAACGLLGALVGNLIGKAVARTNAQKRVAMGPRLTSPDVAFANASVQRADLVETSDGGKATLHTADGIQRRLRWSKTIVKPIDVHAVFERALPGRVTYKPMSTFRKVLPYVALAAIGLLMVVAVIAAALTEDDDLSTTAALDSGLAPAAIGPLQQACDRWVVLNDETVSQETIASVINDVRAPLRTAATADAQLEAAAAGAEQLHSAITGQVTMTEEEATNHGAAVDAACNRLVPG